jgi:hypothetical protein
MIKSDIGDYRTVRADIDIRRRGAAARMGETDGVNASHRLIGLPCSR